MSFIFFILIMKKINFLVWIIIFIFSFSSAFAVGINIETNSSSVTLDEFVTLNIEIDWIKYFNDNLFKINWIDDFDIVSKYFSSSTISINWNVSNTYSINLLLKPNKTWKFEIWPVVYDNLESNLLSIEIGNIDKKNNNNEFNLEKYNENTFLWDNFILIILFVITFWLIGLYYYLNSWSKKSKLNSFNKQTKLEQSEIIYPNIEDENFLECIENIFKQILKLKFNYVFENNEYTILKQNLELKTILWFEELIDNILILKYSWNNDIEIKLRIIYLLKNINGK